MPKKTARRLVDIDTDNGLTVCLIAGGAGFIGSHLCESLLDQNCFVYCLDNFSTGREKNIESFKKNPNFQIVDHDLNSLEKLKLPKKIDYVFHLAGVEAYLNGIDISLETLLVNSFGAKVLLEIAKENQAKFLLVSSEQVYSGFVSEQNLNEYFGQGRTMEAEGAFAEAKRFAEALTFEYVKKYKVNARVARLDFLYGPRMNLESGSILAKIFKEAIEKKELLIPGNGLTRLYPTYISDAVYGLVKAMFSHNSNGRVYSLVNPSMVTILNFAYFLRDRFNDKLQIKFVQGEDLYNFEFPEKSVIDSQEMLGWYPKVEAKEGVLKTLDALVNQDVQPKEIEKEIKAEKKLKTKKEEKTQLKPIEKPPSFIAAKAEEPQEPAVPAVIRPAGDQTEKPAKKIKFSIKFPKIRFIGFKWLLAVFLIILILLAPAGLFIGAAYQTAVSFKNIQEAVEDSNLEQISLSNSKAKTNLKYLRSIFTMFSWAGAKIGLQKQTRLSGQLLRTGEYFSESIDQLRLGSQAGQEMAAIILGNKTGDTLAQLNLLQKNLNEANNSLGFAEAELNKISPEVEKIKIWGINKDIKKLQEKIPELRSLLTESQRIMMIIPGILGFQGKQTYLVLLQNNQELRPTGGFIGSFALITAEKGQILDFTVEDVYTADGQLKGFIKPPEPIKKYLGEDIWWLRDSNISPDFPTSAARASWFLQKEMDREVAGVIGINLQLVQNLLQAIGPVYLPDYKEQITSSNIFERAEYHAEANFFPGSTQKKDFLGSLSKAIFDNLRQTDPDQAIKLIKAVNQSLNEKSIMIWLPGTSEAKVLSQFGWDGSLRIPPDSLSGLGQIDINDYSMPVETNFGVNKANYFIKRQSQQDVSIMKDGTIKESYSLTLENNSPSDSWPGGRYKNYFRIYLPQDAQIEAVMISKSDGEKGDVLKKKDLEMKNELGKLMLGFLVEVPVKEQRKVTIEYQRGKKFPVEQKLATYLFYWQKQSGIGDDPIGFSLSYPMFLRPIKLSEQAEILPQSLKFSSTSEKDRVFAVTFGK